MRESNKSISPLRQRMIEDMVMRKLSPATQRGYIRSVKRFVHFFGRSPDHAEEGRISEGFNCIWRSPGYRVRP